MISILLTTIFPSANPLDPPILSKAGLTNTTLFAAIPPFYGTPGMPSKKLIAIASTNNVKGGAAGPEKAFSYFAALTEANQIAALPKDVSISSYTISAFTKKAGNALVKFWKNVTDITKKTVLSCVIDLSSVGKTETDIAKAENIQSNWLDYFWRLWNDKEETFEKATLYVPLATKTEIDSFAKTYRPFGELKGLMPRSFAGMTPEQETVARTEERYRNVYPLVLLQQKRINVPNLIVTFHKKVGDLLNDLFTNATSPGLQLVKTKTREAFHKDNQPSQLQLAFWGVWEDLIINLNAPSVSPEEVDPQLQASLAELDRIAKIYENMAIANPTVSQAKIDAALPEYLSE